MVTSPLLVFGKLTDLLSRSRSEVYAADLFEAAFSKDPLDPGAGRRWRYQVLERGASQPELEMLEAFLGRPINSDAIIEQIVRGQGM